MALLDPEYLLRVMLVFVRVSSVLATAPFFGQRGIPARVKIMFAVLLAYGMSGMPVGDLPPYALHTFGLMLAVGMETLTGLILGFAGQFIFFAVQFAAELIGFQMGLTMAQVFDPSTSEPTNPVGQMLSLTFMMIFLMVDGHHQVIRAIADSFAIIPLAGANLSAAGPLLLSWTGGFLLSALRLAAPFMVTIFLIDAALGVMARVAPQADLFGISLPLKLMVGLGLCILFMQQFIPVIPGQVEQMVEQVAEMTAALGGR